MKNLRVCHCLGKLDPGGAETLVMNVLRNMKSKDITFDFLVFDSNPGFYDEEVKEKNCNIYYLKSISNVGLKNYLNQLIDFFKQNKFDVVHSHMDWQGGFIAYAAHKAGIKKIVVHSHADQKMFCTDIPHKIMVHINKNLINKYADYCLACSKEAGESLFKGDFKVLFNGVDLQKFQNPNLELMEQIKSEFNIDVLDIVLGSVGSLSSNKNQIFLIELLAELVKNRPNYKLVLVGQGSEEKNLKKRVKELNLEDHVIFTGIRQEIPEFMNIFDIFLFPSIHEGLGIVAIEAQASGTPCIVSDTIPRSVLVNENLISFCKLDLNVWKKRILDRLLFKIKSKVDNKYSINYTCDLLEKIYTEGM